MKKTQNAPKRQPKKTTSTFDHLVEVAHILTKHNEEIRSLKQQIDQIKQFLVI